MDINPMIIIFLGICGVILIWVLFNDLCIKFVERALVGGLMIYGVNLLIPQVAIGINALNITMAGVLGIPGVIMMYTVGYLV